MSDDDDDMFSTRRVAKNEMDRLHEVLAKMERVPEVVITVTPDLYMRVDSVRRLCELPSGPEEEQFAEAVRQILEAGLREYEARVAMEE